MGYSSVNGRKPFERASKAAHHHIINDPEVQAMLRRIEKPPAADDIPLESIAIPFEPLTENPVEAIIAVDGGYSETVIDKHYPSRTMHFMQFGALLFQKVDLDHLDKTRFIAPEDMARLKNIHRLKLAIPTKNLRFKDEESLTGTVRRTVAEFFFNSTLDESQCLMDTLAWFLFKQYKSNSQRTEDDKKWKIAQNPLIEEPEEVYIYESEMKEDYSFTCKKTGGKIWLTDVFRLHEVIDEETGAGGIMGYLVNTIEHFIIIHIIRQLITKRPESLKKVFFIKDGPTGFFGQTARMHKPMLELVNWLFDKHDLMLAGLEKSGAFVDHAKDIQKNMKPGSVLILNNKYIYRYILPGRTDGTTPYGDTSNYGHKIIFKTNAEQMYVVSIPSRKVKCDPTIENLHNLQAILTNVEALRCDMYDSALFPVALVNKLVSLSSHPSQRILQRFAVSQVN